jgi:hypothetical protein
MKKNIEENKGNGRTKNGKKRKRKGKTGGLRGRWTGSREKLTVSGISPSTNVTSHLYQSVCTGWIPGTNESFQPVQMVVFLVVIALVILAPSTI